MRAWTEEQSAAINAEGGSVLVTAAAGSGKTSVLTARVIRKITELHCDIDRLLIVTFTKAAAAEMRERIEAELAKLLEEEPYNRHLLRQQMLLKKSNISTIDSFCTALLREYFQQAGISRDFRIADETEYALMQEEILDSLLEKYYAADDSEFDETTEIFVSDRNDRQLRATVKKLADFLTSHVSPQKWLALAAESAVCRDADKSELGKIACRTGKDRLEYASELISAAKKLLPEAESDSQADAIKLSQTLSSDLKYFSSAVKAAKTEEYSQAFAAIREIEFVRFPTVRDKTVSETAARIKALRDSAKKVVIKLREGIFMYDPEKFSLCSDATASVTKKLGELTAEYSELLREEKLSRNILTFSDLGQLSLAVLVREEDGRLVPTRAAEEYSARFDEILIDEYQDTNEVQDAVFRAISRDGQNLFMVGDMKQSIYSFRNAQPEIFAEKAEVFSPRSEGKFPMKISLNSNFRSRSDVTNFVNFVFHNVMSKPLGGVEYTDDSMLNPAAQYPETGLAGAEFDLLDTALCEDRDVAEAEFIAEKIRSLIEEKYPVSDGNGGLRPANFGDIAVLYRSLASKKSAVLDAFEKNGINVTTEASGGFFECAEVMAMLSLLQVIDNPHDDVPLAAAMMSGILGFSADELAAIAAKRRREDDFYSAAVKAAENGDCHTAEMLEMLSVMRRAAAKYPTDVLIVKIYAMTGYPDTVRAMSDGERRKVNLELLAGYARSFEESGGSGLSAFLRYIKGVREAGGNMAAAIPENVGDAVSLMTIHKSKGLEYPIVIVAGLGTKFNRTDSTSTALIHSKLFFACKYRRDNLVFDTPQHAILAAQVNSEQMSEEMRVLYVAMTRAREKLILVGSRNNATPMLEELAGICDAAYLARLCARNADCPLEWVTAASLRHPFGGSLRDAAGTSPQTDAADGNAAIKLVYPCRAQNTEYAEGESRAEADKAEEEVKPQECICEKLPDGFAEKLMWKYPYAAASVTPTKISVSALTHKSANEAPLARPKFTANTVGHLTGAEKGTATHLFMSLCSLSATETRELCRELDRLVRAGFMTQTQADSVDIAKAAEFTASDIGRRAAAADEKGRCHREFGFDFAIPASEVSGEYDSASTVLVSGVADMVFVEENGIVIVDYKTDKVSEPSELSERYSAQLDLYERALCGLFGADHAEKQIYSFALGRFVKIG